MLAVAGLKFDPVGYEVGLLLPTLLEFCLMARAFNLDYSLTVGVILCSV